MNASSVTAKVRSFFSKFPGKSYKKGEMVIQEGDHPNTIYFLETGSVRQFVSTKDGSESTLTLYKPGAFFPMAWALGVYENAYGFQAMETSTVRGAPSAKVASYVSTENDILLDLLIRVYRGVEGVLSHMTQLMAGNATDRVITVLKILSRRFGAISCTHQELAAMTGLTRETVSRTLSKLKNDGIVKVEGKNILFNTHRN